MEHYLDTARRMMREQDARADHHEPSRLEEVLRGCAIELWADLQGKLFLVADEADARRLMRESVRRGEIYTSREIHHVITIADPRIVAEVHAWKREFDGALQGMP